MNQWHIITNESDLEQLLKNSGDKPQIIFKDSVTCGISAYAKERLIQGYAHLDGKADFHYLDLLSFRSISNLIAQKLGVTHQSPQIIVIKSQSAVYTSSHHAINPEKIAAQL